MARESTISMDLNYIMQQAKANIKRYIDEWLPEEYEKCIVGLTAILREAWATSQQSQDKLEKIQALSLAKECYSMKLMSEGLCHKNMEQFGVRYIISKIFKIS